MKRLPELVLAGLLIAATMSVAANPSTAEDAIARRASEMVITSLHFLGVPYRRAGESAEAGFDCSGFTRHVFETGLGFELPRRADEQAKASGLSKILRAKLEPGDLIFFNTRKRTYSHVGIYVGEGRFIHAPRPGAAVRVESMRSAYWAKRYTGARRARFGFVLEPPDSDPGRDPIESNLAIASPQAGP